MFPETEILNEINGITFRMYVEQKRVTLVIGFSMNTVTAEKITFGLRATSTFLRGTVRPGFLCGISEKIFDDEDAGGGGKALKVTFKGFNADWTGQKNATIDLGGKYKVSEIESVVIRYKIVAGNANVW